MKVFENSKEKDSVSPHGLHCARMQDLVLKEAIPQSSPARQPLPSCCYFCATTKDPLRLHNIRNARYGPGVQD